MSRLLAIAALLALHVAAYGEEAVSPEPIVIVVPGGAAQPAQTVAEMRREVARLLAPADLAAEWRNGITSGEHFAQLLTVEFRGSCLAEPMVRAGLSELDTKRLAHAAVSDSAVLPFATVECDALRRKLSAALSSARADERAVLMGRAMGRVVAHEVYHIVTKTRRHSSHGASKACFGVPDLIAADFSFDRLTLAQMRPSSQMPSYASAPEAFYETESGR